MLCMSVNFSQHRDQTPDKGNVRKEDLLCLTFERYCLYVSSVKKWRERGGGRNASAFSSFSVYSVLDPSLGDGGAHI